MGEDKEVVLVAVGKGWTLRRVPEEMKGDRDIVMAAVLQDRQALEWASGELKDDKAIVLTAVKKYGYALTYACARLRDNHEEWRIEDRGGYMMDRNWLGLK